MHNNSVPQKVVIKVPILGAEVNTDVDVVCLAERKNTRIIAAFFQIAEELRPAIG